MTAPHASEAPETDDLWSWSATAMAQGIARGVVSSREVTESCLARIHEVNPDLNGIVEVFDDALETAADADRKRARGDALGPLHGVPVATKVNVDHAGHATTEGVVAWRDNMVAADGPAVAKLRAGGAVFVGRTNTPALSFRWFTDNDLHGRTYNPWSRDVTPGGSSGGSSSAVASGMVPLAHGTDIGGSVRYPAYACGIVGLRPTVGRIPSWNGPDAADQGLMFQLMNTQGILARSVADARLAIGAMSGFDSRDANSLPFDIPSVPSVEAPIRVAIVRDAGVVAPDPTVNAALDQASEWLAAAGYQVVERDLPLLGEAYRLWYLLCLTELRTNMGLVEEFGDRGMKLAAEHYFAHASQWWGAEADLKDFVAGYARRGTLRRGLQEAMLETPLILTPVSATRQFPHDMDIVDAESMARVASAQWPMMAVPTLGFPALSVPTGVTDGLPDGVQLLGPRWHEDMLLDAAAVIEAQAGRFTPISPG